MERVLIAVGIALAVAVLAWVLERRRPQAPTQGRWAVPNQLDRADFDRPGAPWLVAVFSSATCDSCATTVELARTLASADVAVQEVDVAVRGDLHRRYNIEAVPSLVVADRLGVVRATFVGPPAADELRAAFADARGSATDLERGLG